MLLDIEETPILSMLLINGRLTFNPEIDVSLRAHQIFVQGGQIFIGTPEEPYSRNGTITLYGASTDATLVMTGAIEAGNKIFATTGTISMYGQPRSRMSRLHGIAEATATSFTVEAGLDWV